MSLTLDGDEECEEEERGEDEGGEGFVRESHLINSFDSCGKDKKVILYIYIYDIVLSEGLACQVAG